MFFKWKARNQSILEQNPEIANIPRNQRKPVLGIENLGEPLQWMHLNAIASQQKHKTVLAQLEQQITQLERDLTDARELCSQKDQAIRKRDDLLRESALLRARDDIKGKVAEVEHFDSMVKKLKARYRGHTERKDRKARKAYHIQNSDSAGKSGTAEAVQRDEIQLIRATKIDFNKAFIIFQPKNLARQDEKLLMESSLKASQEQLSEQRTEQFSQTSRKSQPELKPL
ncbi:hypothetical protein lerEdw1_008944 [Lerista edwardsae]|nr:hypothetical protein lerEdw1_008944 [Lerista edwardsae]